MRAKKSTKEIEELIDLDLWKAYWIKQYFEAEQFLEEIRNLNEAKEKTKEKQEV